MLTPDSIAIYIHWPFCKSKCPYCDFNSHVREQVDYDAWESAYLRELTYFAPLLHGRKITSIFFGGGTPSLMPPAIAASIINKLSIVSNLSDAIEITLEANPTSVEIEKFKDFRQAGINRVSLGVQSLRADDLAFLGREHSAGEAINAIDLAREIFPRYSFDLIYARPNQTLKAWDKELQEALTLTENHLSLYQLTIEKGTAFYGHHRAGSFQMPSEELSADFFDITQNIMDDAGHPAYEVSNHAHVGKECRHNLSYWRYDDYLGIGPGAHSRVTIEGNKTAMMMQHNPENWLKSVSAKGHGLQQNEVLNEEEHKEEMLLMGLRLKEGIPRTRFSRPPEQIFPTEKLALLQQEGLLVLDNKRLYATRQGMKVLNGLVKELLV